MARRRGEAGLCRMIVTTTIALILALPTTASATTCEGLLSFDGAAVVLDGVAQTGPAAPDGTLASPATFEVLRYAKATGPGSVQVDTGTTVENGVVGVIPGSIAPRAGEIWRILVAPDTDLTGLIPTVCTQSERLQDGAATPPTRNAFDAAVPWWAWTAIALSLTMSGIGWHHRSRLRAPRDLATLT
jgi:hypothetical protein